MSERGTLSEKKAPILLEITTAEEVSDGQRGDALDREQSRDL